MNNLQVVIHNTTSGFERLHKEGVGTSFSFVGTIVESPGEGQTFELVVKNSTTDSMIIYGNSNQNEYPLSKKKHSKEFLREKMNLRPRTNLIGTASRIRNSLSVATHEFFQKRGFNYIHTPIITSSD